MRNTDKLYYTKAKFDSSVGDYGAIVLDDSLVFVLSEQPQIGNFYPCDGDTKDDYYRGYFYASAYDITDEFKEKEYEINWDITKDYDPKSSNENEACDWDNPQSITNLSENSTIYQKKVIKWDIYLRYTNTRFDKNIGDHGAIIADIIDIGDYGNATANVKIGETMTFVLTEQPTFKTFWYVACAYDITDMDTVYKITWHDNENSGDIDDLNRPSCIWRP